MPKFTWCLLGYNPTLVHQCLERQAVNTGSHSASSTLPSQATSSQPYPRINKKKNLRTNGCQLPWKLTGIHGISSPSDKILNDIEHPLISSLSGATEPNHFTMVRGYVSHPF